MLASTSHARLFVAFDTPPQMKAVMNEIKDRLRSSKAEVRWDSMDKFHCTLKFLGDTHADQVAGIEEALAEIARDTHPFSVRYSAVGCFPNKREPRVVWIGIENGDGILDVFARRIDARLASFGFERETRTFHPHVTLGRIKGRRNLASLLGIMETVTFESPLFTIGQFELIRSELKPAGSVYTVIRSFTLT